MSRIDRMIKRRQEAKRPIRLCQKPVAVRDTMTGKVSFVRTGHHRQGDQWWRVKQAEFSEKRGDGDQVARQRKKQANNRSSQEISDAECETLEATAKNWERPDGMSRQVYRDINRHSVKSALRARRRSAG